MGRCMYMSLALTAVARKLPFGMPEHPIGGRYLPSISFCGRQTL
jgi:hypothetical protein